jgi:glycosyltransferase involved in cell wall biosynthesis
MEKLIMVTQNYPSGKGEIYLERELACFSKKYQEIHIYPIKIVSGELRNVPSNVFIHDLISKRSGKVKYSILLKNIFLIIQILFLEYKHTIAKRFFISNLKMIASELIQCFELAEKFICESVLKDAKCSFYSVWMDEGALMFAILKDQKKISDFVFRLHGYDLYDERRPGNYMPFRYYNFKQAKKIFIVSKAGKDYLVHKKLFPEKLIVNYSGSNDNGENPFDKDAFVIVSVSNIIPLKRVNKIIEILHYIDFPVKWIHFGEGVIKDKLIGSASALPQNVTWEFNGQTGQNELNKFYSQTSVNLFIHLSETEGLPLAIVEALSYGIPAMACNVGGIPEIVNEQTGILLPENFDVRLVAHKIVNFRSSHMNDLKFRKGVRDFWKNNFDAEKNYPEFVEIVKK